MGSLSCGTQDLVTWPGIEPRVLDIGPLFMMLSDLLSAWDSVCCIADTLESCAYL